MTRKSIRKTGISLVGATLMLVNPAATFADDQSNISTPQIKILKKSNLHLDNKTEVWIREHIYQPGWKAPTHKHSSDLYIYVVSGAFELTTQEDGRVVYEAGQAVLMKPGLVMDAGNASSIEQLKLAVFQVGEVDKPFVIPIN